MNEDKTEYVHVYLAKKGDIGPEGKPLVDNEPWRSSKLLGSLLCGTKDIERRIILGNIAFSNFKKVWQQGRNIGLKRLLRVYDSQVLSIVMYNCSSWAVSKQVMDKLDIAHRKHLRSILGIRWPGKISNKRLYEVTNSTPLSTRTERSRWRLFGHILRCDEMTPASLSLTFAAESLQSLKGRRGRHRINLFNTLKADLASRNLNFNIQSCDDIRTLRDIAINRKFWKSVE